MSIPLQKSVKACDIPIWTMAENKWDQKPLPIPLLAGEIRIRNKQSSDKSHQKILRQELSSV